jgi:hypothetical protein
VGKYVGVDEKEEDGGARREERRSRKRKRAYKSFLRPCQFGDFES